MDIRVGKIVDICVNPNSDKLYNEKIDIGGGEIREIASGLQKFIPIEKLRDAPVVVLVNLKAKKLADYMSHGMVLCA
jgi:tRNA-binding EMAP/Myf-like protein